MKNMYKTIYGDRICLGCRGLVSGLVLRSIYGTRKKYYCSKHCVEGFIYKKENKKRKSGKEYLSDKGVKIVAGGIIKYLEPVYVRPKKS